MYHHEGGDQEMSGRGLATCGFGLLAFQLPNEPKSETPDPKPFEVRQASKTCGIRQ